MEYGKRKLTMDLFESAKKKINCVEENMIVLEKDEEGMFSLGSDVFVLANTFRGQPKVHIRRFQKYGTKLYPTKEGITLEPEWTESIMQRTLPTEELDLRGSFSMPANEFKIDSEDFQNFTFTRFQTTPKGDIIRKSIILSASQWKQMQWKSDAICSSVLHEVYGAMDLSTVCKNYGDFPNLYNTLPLTLDVNSGTQCVLDILQNSLSDCFRERGLKNPQVYAEELWAHRPKMFNSTAFAVDLKEIADNFFPRLFEHVNYLCLGTPAMYITSQFLQNIKLNEMLKLVYNEFCPSGTFEFYEDEHGKPVLK